MILFLSNKYAHCYFQIVNRAKIRLTKLDYSEIHHIIPKSLGGDNSSDNKVKLTAREHYICHALLPKFTEGKNKSLMLFAWHCITQRGKYKPCSKLYDASKRKHAQNVSIRMKGKIMSKESRMKMSLSAKARAPISEETKKRMSISRSKNSSWNKGLKLKPETIAKISESVCGTKNGMYGKTHSLEAKIKQSLSRIGKSPSNKGIPMSDEQKLKLSIAKRGKSAWNKGIPLNTVICAGCGKEASKQALGRYHKECAKQ